jgi:surface-anchored protein
MTAAVQERQALRSRKKTIGSSLLAGVGALALAISVPAAAHAASYSVGDYDGVEIELNGSAFEVGTHNHQPGTYPDFDPVNDQFITDSAGWIYSDGSGGLEVGIATDSGLPANTTLTLTSATFTATDGSPVNAAADVEVYEGSSGNLLFNTVAGAGQPADWSATVPGGYHDHPDWSFKNGEPGTYTLTFSVSASGSGYTPYTGYTLTFIVP